MDLLGCGSGYRKPGGTMLRKVLYFITLVAICFLTRNLVADELAGVVKAPQRVLVLGDSQMYYMGGLYSQTINGFGNMISHVVSFCGSQPYSWIMGGKNYCGVTEWLENGRVCDWRPNSMQPCLGIQPDPEGKVVPPVPKLGTLLQTFYGSKENSEGKFDKLIFQAGTNYMGYSPAWVINGLDNSDPCGEKTPLDDKNSGGAQQLTCVVRIAKAHGSSSCALIGPPQCNLYCPDKLHCPCSAQNQQSLNAIDRMFAAVASRENCQFISNIQREPGADNDHIHMPQSAARKWAQENLKQIQF